MEPVKLYTPAMDILAYEIVFPSGKKISLGRGKCHLTADPEEIEFASRLKGVGVAALNDAEFRTYVTNLGPIPNVENKSLTNEQADEFRWTADQEEKVVTALRTRGYSVRKPKARKGKK